jgi:hypothetical protein
VTAKKGAPAHRLGAALLFGVILLTVLGIIFQQIRSASTTRSAGSSSATQPGAIPPPEPAYDQGNPKGPAMTPAEASASQKAMLDTAEVYKQAIAFSHQVEAENPTGVCASISDVKANTRHALSSLRKVPRSRATLPMIEALQPGLLDIQSGAGSIQSACETGVPVQDEPLAKMTSGMRTINAFTTSKGNLPTTSK